MAMKDLGILILSSVIGAVISYLVPVFLDPILKRGRVKTQTKSFPWFSWCVALTIAGGVGGFISGLLGIIGWNTPGGLGNWAAFGTCIGIAQWLVLQRQQKITPMWAVASTLGWSVFAFFEFTKAPGGWIFVGFTIGLLQWLILRKIWNKAILWVPANIVAWPAGGLIAVASGHAMIQAGVPFPLPWTIGWAVVGLIGSIILGFGLTWMPLKINTK